MKANLWLYSPRHRSPHRSPESCHPCTRCCGTHLHLHIHIFAFIYSYIYTYPCTNIHGYMYLHICAFTYRKYAVSPLVLTSLNRPAISIQQKKNFIMNQINDTQIHLSIVINNIHTSIELTSHEEKEALMFLRCYCVFKDHLWHRG
jgi:hypothetical protein